MFWGRNVTTKSSSSRLIDTCLRKGKALFRKDSTTSNADIFATHILTRAGRNHFTALATPQAPTTAQSLLAEHGDCTTDVAAGYNPAMGFNKRKMEDQRRQATEREAAARRATEKQILEDADHLITVWNERQAKRMPMLFSPTMGAAITAGYWFLRVCCPACRTTGDVDLRTLDWHRGAAVTALTPALSCRSCRPNAPFAELVQLSRSSVLDEWNVERGRAVLGD
jgi:hypothetical protein